MYAAGALRLRFLPVMLPARHPPPAAGEYYRITRSPCAASARFLVALCTAVQVHLPFSDRQTGNWQQCERSTKAAALNFGCGCGAAAERSSFVVPTDQAGWLLANNKWQYIRFTLLLRNHTRSSHRNARSNTNKSFASRRVAR